MDLLTVLRWWLSHSLYQLIYPIIESAGFKNPTTMVLIIMYNTAAILYLYLLTAIVYPLFKEKSWKIAFSITTTWMLVGILILVAVFQQNQRLAIMSITPHAYIELTAIFYWINALRKTCLRKPEIKLKTYDFKDYISSIKNHENVLKLAKYDFLAFLKAANKSFKSFWNKETKIKLLITISLLVLSAFIETYITPTFMGL